MQVALLERLSELARLASPFAVGLRLDTPLRDKRWRLPLRLAFVSMTAMVSLTDTLLTLTRWTVAASIVVVHGVTAQPSVARCLNWLRRRHLSRAAAGR